MDDDDEEQLVYQRIVDSKQAGRLTIILFFWLALVLGIMVMALG